jgi:nucleotide-binding universal stress UspA family protein
MQTNMETQKKNTILVPVDFSDIAANALNHAIQVAKHFNNNLALLHVVEESGLPSFLSFGKENAASKLMVHQATEQLTEMAADIKAKHHIDCAIVSKVGRIYKVIAETATELGCDSIIMGSNGAAGFEQIIGSNASRVISHSGVPVIVIKPQVESFRAYNNIVFPLDLTIESRQKVKWAIHLGKAYHSTINILTYKVGDEFLNNKMKLGLRQVERLLNENDIPFKVEVLDELEENWAEETLKYAEKVNADLLMIMTQSEEKGFSEYIIGTFAQQIVNKATKVPVMCINPSPMGFSNDFSI